MYAYDQTHSALLKAWQVGTTSSTAVDPLLALGKIAKKMGALDYLSNFCTVTSTRTKQKAMQTTEIKVRMDCDGCERRVRNAVSSIKGVKSVEVNRKESRVVVRGYVDPKKVLKRVRSTGKVRAQFWPYVEQHLV
ncbi:heavy metal-associated isoprenylated plant protein 21 [Glycine max]|nr:heavy metal-associated isoprenylated plant protein 21 [Glycine max]